MAAVPGPTATAAGTSEADLRQALGAALRELGGGRSLVVGDARGLPIASAGGGGPSLAATAMATLAMSAANRVTSSLGLPEAEDVLIEAGAWTVLVRGLGRGRTLCLVVPSAANLGFVRLTLARHAEVVRALLDDLG